MAKKSTGSSKLLDKGITIEFGTKDLQKLCNKVSKGVRNNKVVDITAVVLLSLKDNVFTMTSTDQTTNVECKMDKVLGKDFEVLVDADTFTKLITKTTTEKVTITVTQPETDEDNATLKVKGNGDYSFETIALPEGDQFPNFSFECKKPTKVKKAILDKAIHNNRPATSDNTTQLALTGIYFSDEVISSDSEKAAATKANVFKKDILLRPEAIDLLSILEGEELDVSFNDDRIIITDGTSTIYTAEMTNKDDYPLQVIRDFIYEGDFPFTCFVDKTELLGCLDRLSIFTDAYSCNGVEMFFDTNSVTLTNTKNKGASEEIAYGEDSKGCKPFTCSIVADMLKSQIQVVGDKVELNYGNDKALRIKDGNLTLLVAYLEEEE